MKIVYAVSTGCYSDYRVKAIFTTRQKAQHYIDNYSSELDSPEIEEYYLDAVDGTPKREWMVDFDEKGNVSEVHRGDLATRPEKIGHSAWHSATYGNKYGDPVCLRVYNIHAKDEKHAVKIASDERAMWLVSLKKENK